MPPILHPKAQKLLQENPFSVMNNPEPTSSAPTPTPTPPAPPRAPGLSPVATTGGTGLAIQGSSPNIGPHGQLYRYKRAGRNPFMISLNSDVDLMPLTIL